MGSGASRITVQTNDGTTYVSSAGYIAPQKTRVRSGPFVRYFFPNAFARNDVCLCFFLFMLFIFALGLGLTGMSLNENNFDPDIAKISSVSSSCNALTEPSDACGKHNYQERRWTTIEWWLIKPFFIQLFFVIALAWVYMYYQDTVIGGFYYVACGCAFLGLFFLAGLIIAWIYYMINCKHYAFCPNIEYWSNLTSGKPNDEPAADMVMYLVFAVLCFLADIGVIWFLGSYKDSQNAISNSVANSLPMMNPINTGSSADSVGTRSTGAHYKLPRTQVSFNALDKTV